MSDSWHGDWRIQDSVIIGNLTPQAVRVLRVTSWSIELYIDLITLDQEAGEPMSGSINLRLVLCFLINLTVCERKEKIASDLSPSLSPSVFYSVPMLRYHLFLFFSPFHVVLRVFIFPPALRIGTLLFSCGSMNELLPLTASLFLMALTACVEISV